MAGIKKLDDQLIYVEDESLAYDEPIKAEHAESDEVWMNAIDSESVVDGQTNPLDSWVIEDNSAVLEDYIDEVTDTIQFDLGDTIDW